MMYCNKCHELVKSDEDRFCRKCFNTLPKRDSKPKKEGAKDKLSAIPNSEPIKEAVEDKLPVTPQPEPVKEVVEDKLPVIPQPEPVKEVVEDKPPVTPSPEPVEKIMEDKPSAPRVKVKKRIFVSHPALYNAKHYIILGTIMIVSFALAIITSVTNERNSMSGATAFWILMGVIALIALFFVLYAAASLQEYGYVDFHIEGGGKHRYFADGRKEVLTRYRGSWIANDVTDYSIVYEVEEIKKNSK